MSQTTLWGPSDLPPERDLLARTKKLMPAYGVRREDLKGIAKAPRGIHTLQRIYFGSHVVNIPPQVLESLNPIEILAAYGGVYKARMEDYSFRERPDLLRMMPVRPSRLETVVDDFILCIHKGFELQGVGKGNHANHKNNAYPTDKGSLSRLHQLPQGTKRGLRMAMNPPAEVQLPYDRNSDGRNVGLYIADIFRVLSSRFEYNQRTSEALKTGFNIT